MFVMIQNSGVADVRSFTKLGLSSARGESDKIGQFGSGAKHGVLTLMRHGLNPHIYCGKTRLQFFSQPAKMGSTSYGDMFVKIDSAKPQELSFCLEFGALDWTDVAMGLREIVSNAIDNSDDTENIVISVVDKPRAKDGFTRVFVPMNADVQKFLNTISDRFLQFSDRPSNQTILEKTSDGSAKIYRKGVFVRELDRRNKLSLFDYNFGDELEIDECRNSSDYNCLQNIAYVISKDRKALVNIFSHIIARKTDYIEFEVSRYSLHTTSDWKEVWENIAGEDAVIIQENSALLADFIVKKGKKVYVVPDDWYYAMSRAGIPQGITYLDSNETKGCMRVDTPPQATTIHNQLWGWLSELGLTNGKKQPELSCFSKVMDSSESMLCGYYENGTVYINIDNVDNRMTYLEEIVHYVTDATDASRAFQEYFIQATNRLLSIVFE